jgi:hypothetical protein
MTLHVDFDHFVEACERHLKSTVVYVSRFENKTHVTAADPALQLIISASTKQSTDEVRQALAKTNLEVRTGGWTEGSTGPSDSLGELPYITAISYRTNEDMPGIWVDAYSDPPTPAIALKAIYEEFRETGEIGEMAFEEFVRLANPNVAVVTPTELERFISDKNGCD